MKKSFILNEAAIFSSFTLFFWFSPFSRCPVQMVFSKNSNARTFSAKFLAVFSTPIFSSLPKIFRCKEIMTRQ